MSDRLVWIDMEMTGLDPARERIIEIAAIVTDGQLDIIAQGPSFIVHQPDEILDAMDAWNTRHHGASGLTEAVRTSTVTEADAEEQVLSFVADHCPARSTPLAGNSVHQDRMFLARYMPSLETHMHYRNVDVSTIKELARRWYPSELASAPTKAEAHRALDDIRESIAELAYYRRTLFK